MIEPIVLSTTCPRCSQTVSATPDPISGTVICNGCGTRFDPRAEATAAVSTSADLTTDSPALWQPQAGDRCGPYTLISELGRGGMATVWRAKQDSLDRDVAVKILHAHLAADPELRRRFEREAEAMVLLDHPHVVPVIDRGEHHGRPYLVTTLAGTKTLRDELDQRALSPQRLERITTHILDGLEHAHRKGLVHRDVKPENIIIDNHDDAYLADFGIAQVNRALDGHTLTHLTRDDAVLGTLAYMAPEQAISSAQVDHRCDLYALGVLCYEALTGHLPQGRFENPSQTRDDLSPQQQQRWDAFILSCLERDVRRRPSDAAAARALLTASGTVNSASAQASTKVNSKTNPQATTPATTNQRSHPAQFSHSQPYPHGRQLYRNRDLKWIGGVLGGLSAWSGIHASWLRLLFLFGPACSPIVGYPTMITAYVIALVIIPTCPHPPYQPRPLNADLPARPDGWILGVCALAGKNTIIPTFLWRLGALICMPLIWPIYIILGIVLPSALIIHQRHLPTKLITRHKHTHATRTHSANQQAFSNASSTSIRQFTGLRFWGACALMIAAMAFIAQHYELAAQSWLWTATAITAAIAAVQHWHHDHRPRSSSIGGLAFGGSAAGLFLLSALATQQLDHAIIFGLSLTLLGLFGMLQLAALIRGSHPATAQLLAALLTLAVTGAAIHYDLPNTIHWPANLTIVAVGSATWLVAAAALFPLIHWLTTPASPEDPANSRFAGSLIAIGSLGCVIIALVMVVSLGDALQPQWPALKASTLLTLGLAGIIVLGTGRLSSRNTAPSDQRPALPPAAHP